MSLYPSGGVTAVSFAHPGNMSRKGAQHGTRTYGVCSTGPESLDEDTRLPSVPPEGSFRLQPPLVAGRLDLNECVCGGDIDICIGMWEVILRREASPHIPSERLPGVLLSDTRGRKMLTDGQGWDFSGCPSPDSWQGVSPVG